MKIMKIVFLFSDKLIMADTNKIQQTYYAPKCLFDIFVKY